MSDKKQLKHTPLYLEHLALNAKMVPFGGWKMPLQYTGIISEYEQCRNSVSLFDVCHMGEFVVDGDCEKSGLDRIVTQRIQDMPVKSCRYGFILNEKGGIIDDLIVFRTDKEKWMIVVNAATIEKDEKVFRSNLTKNAEFKNVSSHLGKLDVQGPLARDVIKELSPDIEKLNYYTFDYFSILGENVVVSRTGYTGELGYEIYFPADRIIKLWQMLLENAKIKPAGLGARDVLRLEMCYSLYGQDIDETISPQEASLATFVDFDKYFNGRDALLKEKESGVKRKTIFFKSQDRRSPRHGNKLFDNKFKEIGIVTSGCFSPSLKLGIGIGLVSSGSDIEKEIYFGKEKNLNKAIIVKRPFYTTGSLKK